MPVRTTLGLLPLIALSAALTGPAMAQQATTTTTATATEEEVTRNADGEIPLEQVNVQGQGATSPNTLGASTGIGRLPGTVQDTPQVIQVIPQEIMQQQQTQTLEQVLRNVPGVTMTVGEGGGGMNGDQFRIRGFEAKGDIYTDGLRDFGVYTRDSFAYEQVEVIKGPSSESFGMGTTGGAINTQLKKAHRGNEITVEGQGGNGPLYRGVLDVNREINETTAFRFVAMGHWQDLVDRDNNKSDRAGVLATAAFGIGTDFTWDISYLYQYGDRTPDYGVPFVTAPWETVSQPITEYGIPRSNFYGKIQDRDETNTNAVISKAQWDQSDWLTIYNDTRLSFYDRDFATSVPACANNTNSTPPILCQSNFFAGIPTTISGYGGGNPAYLQDSWGIQNVTTGVAEFETGQFKHQLVGGLDLFYQNDHRDGVSTVGTKTLPDIWNPGATYDDLGYRLEKNPNNIKDAEATDVGVFVSDRFWITPEISVLGGVRWDYYDSEYTTVTANGTSTVSEKTSLLSPRASVILEPNDSQTYYVSWAQSFSPPGQFVTNATNPINSGQPNLEPEKNDLYEAGAKIDLLGGALGVTGAVFQINKSNSRYTDPVTGDVIVTGEEHRVQGIEVGITGNPTAAWTVGLTYTYLNSRIADATVAANIGNEVPYTTDNAASLWTSYEVSRHLEIDGKLLVGGGMFYSDGYYTNAANTAWLPGNFSFDAFMSYEFDNFRVSLNGYNLTDELNYSAGWGNRAVVAPGRSFVVSASATF